FMGDLLSSLSGAPLPIRTLDYRSGPSWEPAATLQVPDDWPSGLYVAHVSAGSLVVGGGGGVGSEGALAPRAGPGSGLYSVHLPFVVRAGQPGSPSNILVFVNDTTYEAY